MVTAPIRCNDLRDVNTTAVVQSRQVDIARYDPAYRQPSTTGAL